MVVVLFSATLAREVFNVNKHYDYIETALNSSPFSTYWLDFFLLAIESRLKDFFNKQLNSAVVPDK